MLRADRLFQIVLLGFRSVAQLRGQDARALWRRLCELCGRRQDPCVEDVFRCAVAQAEHPDLPARFRRWYEWTPLRGREPSARPPGWEASDERSAARVRKTEPPAAPRSTRARRGRGG